MDELSLTKMSYQCDLKTSKKLESINNQELNGQIIEELSPKMFRPWSSKGTNDSFVIYLYHTNCIKA